MGGFALSCLHYCVYSGDGFARLLLQFFRSPRSHCKPRIKLHFNLQPVCSPLCLTTMIFCGLVAETHTAYGQNTVIIIEEESNSFGLRAVHFETNRAHCIFIYNICIQPYIISQVHVLYLQRDYGILPQRDFYFPIKNIKVHIVLDRYYELICGNKVGKADSKKNSKSLYGI